MTDLVYLPNRDNDAEMATAALQYYNSSLHLRDILQQGFIESVKKHHLTSVFLVRTDVIDNSDNETLNYNGII